MLKIDFKKGLSEDCGRQEMFFALSADEDVRATADREALRSESVTLRKRYFPTALVSDGGSSLLRTSCARGA